MTKSGISKPEHKNGDCCSYSTMILRLNSSKDISYFKRKEASKRISKKNKIVILFDGGPTGHNFLTRSKSLGKNICSPIIDILQTIHTHILSLGMSDYQFSNY
jgi:hypothetical protein